MASADFQVEDVWRDGTVIGLNCGEAVPAGICFTRICKTRIEGVSPNFHTVELGVAAHVALTLKAVEVFRKPVVEIPKGYSAGLRLMGVGIDDLRAAFDAAQPRERIHLRAYPED